MKKKLSKVLLFVCCAVVVGLWLWSRFAGSSEHEKDVSKRVTNCVIRLNGQEAATHSFAMDEPITMTGEMKLVAPTEDKVPFYFANLVALDHPKVKDIIANSAFLEAKIQGDVSTFTGQMKAPKRAGSYELRLCFADTGSNSRVIETINEALSKVGLSGFGNRRIRRFYRVPVTVRPDDSL